MLGGVPGLDSVRLTYDSRGRLSQEQVGGRIWTYSYDSRGRRLSTMDPLGRRDSLFYDDADRLVRRVLPGGSVVGFAYDSSGNLTGITPAGRPAHTFTYSSVDLAGSYTPPNAGLTTPGTSYQYNADRQPTLMVRPDTGEVILSYDTAGRPTTVTFDRGLLSYAYNASSGTVNTITAPGGNSLVYTYDGALPTSVTWSGTVSGSVVVAYNNDFQVMAQTVNGANSVSFAYDRDGLLTQAGALRLKWHPQHGLLERDSVGSVLGVWTFDPKGALASYAASSSGNSLFQTSYVRDSLGRISQLTETVQGSTTTGTFGYDSAGRLSTVTENGVLTRTYDYDANGNRLSVIGPGVSLSGSYDAQDRLLSYGTTTYSYTSNGELKLKIAETDTTSYTYDWLGNLTQVRLPDGTLIEYVIDGQNRRVGKKVNGVLRQGWLWQSQLAPVAELDTAGAVASRFVYATRVNVPDFMVKGGQTYRLILDHLGSVRIVANTAADTVAQRIDYDEFGRVTQNTNPGFQPFAYAGGLYDHQTGLLSFGARDYEATTGRWTAKDPIGFAGGDGNLYAYVGDDPVNYSDPTGLDQFVRCETAKLLRDLVDAMSKDAGRFWPRWPNEFDFRAEDERKHGRNNLQDYYQLDGQWLRSDEFGNFAAGYAGGRLFGVLGWTAVRFGGIQVARTGESGEDPLDLDSAPMINRGALRARQERGSPSVDGWRAQHGLPPLPKLRPLTEPCGC